MRSPSEYILHAVGKEWTIQDLPALRKRISVLTANQHIDFWLIRRQSELKGFERTLYRFLGLSVANDGPSAYVVGDEDKAVLVFLDEDGNESRVVNDRYAGARDAKVKFVLATGEHDWFSADEVIELDVALQAVEEFFLSGQPPARLHYRNSGRRRR